MRQTSSEDRGGKQARTHSPATKTSSAGDPAATGGLPDLNGDIAQPAEAAVTEDLSDPIGHRDGTVETKSEDLSDPSGGYERRRTTTKGDLPDPSGKGEGQTTRRRGKERWTRATATVQLTKVLPLPRRPTAAKRAANRGPAGASAFTRADEHTSQAWHDGAYPRLMSCKNSRRPKPIC